MTATIAAAAAPAGAVTLPAGFTDTVVAAVGAPTAIAFTPDGRMLVTTQPGRLRVVAADGTLVATPALDLSLVTCSNSERGMLGVAVDPSFASNHFIYIYYTFKNTDTCTTGSATTPVNRVSRFVLDANTADPASELVLVDNIPSTAGNHNAGDVEFGKDGNLYISVGDGGCDYLTPTNCAGSNNASRDENVLLGKILRITPAGAIPSDNPYANPLISNSARCNVAGRTTTAARCQETFAWGLRNPFRMAFDPNAAGTRFHINDVGQNVWEEIDLAAAAADYGWNVREGHCANGSTTDCGAPPAGMTNPIFDYGRSDGCASITGGAFVPNGVWPAPYAGTYLFADYVCGRIFQLLPSGSTFTRSTFADALGASSAVDMKFGPFGGGQALYYSSYQSGGTIHRITYNAVNNPPTAALTANPTSGPPGVVVTLDGSGSSDPNPGDTLTYVWDFGDGSPATQTSSSSTTHTYASAGSFTASLTVRDDKGASSSPATVRIDVGNTAPQPVITTPAAGQRFAVGEVIALGGSATDAQDGTLPASALTWEVIRHHAAHTHPWLGPVTGNSSSFTGAAPEDLLATTNSYLEVRLTATDSSGASATVSRDVQPKLVNLTFTTKPGNLNLQLNGTTFAATRTWTSWDGWDVTVNAPDQGRNAFVSWSDGGARSHVIHTPTTARTYTATYRKTKP
jgi:glucose/arabinose dehydrogenase/PKD repeat protein